MGTLEGGGGMTGLEFGKWEVFGGVIEFWRGR